MLNASMETRRSIFIILLKSFFLFKVIILIISSLSPYIASFGYTVDDPSEFSSFMDILLIAI